MSIPVMCPECDHRFSVRDEYVGRRGKCPSCGGVFRAEAAEVSLSVGESLTSVPVPRSKNGALDASNGGAWGNFNNEALAIAAPNARALKSKQVSPVPAAVLPEVQSPSMNLAGWITIGVLGVSATIGAVLLYMSNVASAKSELAAAVEKLDAGKRAEQIEQQYQTELKQLNAEVAKLKALLEASENGTREVAAKPNAFEEQLITACVKVKAYGDDEKKKLIATASGFFVDDKCTIVTTYDVLAGAKRVTFLASSRFEHEIIGLLAADPKLNLAVLRPKEPLKGPTHLKLAKKPTLIPGRTIYSLGNPGRQEFTVARGIITRVVPSDYLAKEKQTFFGSDFKPGDATFTYVEHDARIFPGDFGGPLLNDQFEVIGVNMGLATMVMNDGLTVVPTLGGGCTVDSVEKVIATINDVPLPYPPAKEKKNAGKRPEIKEDEPKPDDKKQEEKDEKSDDAEEENPTATGPAKEIEAAAEACDEFEWTAANEEEYGALVKFAKLVAKAQKEASADNEVKDAVLAGLQKLQAAKWSADDKRELNKLAAGQAAKKGEGTLFFGKIASASGAEGKKTLLVSLEDTEMHAIVPEFGGPVSPGSQVLLLGIFTHDATVTVEVTDPSGEKKRTKAFRVAAVGGLSIGG